MILIGSLSRYNPMTGVSQYENPHEDGAEAAYYEAEGGAGGWMTAEDAAFRSGTTRKQGVAARTRGAAPPPWISGCPLCCRIAAHAGRPVGPPCGGACLSVYG